jgi:hypothetical protein
MAKIAITSGRPKPTPTRMRGGISGLGGKNITKDYKETGNKKNVWEKIQYTFRTKPVESDESLRYHKELESAKRNKNK